jgi:hypothetical protein
MLLEAVFLWIILFEAALLSAFTASRSALPASSLLPEATADSTFFTIVLIALRTSLLRRFRFTACLALFMADRFFFGFALAGNLYPPD